MAGENVDNKFEHPSAGSTDNVFVMGGSTKGSSGAQNAAITDPTGGGTVDAEARTAIDAILAALQNNGIIAS